MVLSFCHGCNDLITCKDPVVTCSGFCENARTYHAVCVGLSVKEGIACENPNILWICNNCRKAREDMRASKKSDSDDILRSNEIDVIKLEMEKMKVLLNKLAHDFGSFHPPSNPPDRKENNDTDQDVLNSSILTSTRIDNPIHPQAVTNTSLFVSNIAPDVPDEVVMRMIRETIGPDNIVSIKCLVPAWKEKSTLNYISYKIVVNIKPGTESLAINWPKGVRCREFVDRFNESWRPATV